jgi:acyl transferase domain-containing protein/NAD(P)H-dependent flavin oxidoreductase YrpB (nitropropane dioxygenase family)/NAD(P)-dependent dehydrogenase (short-subunit alcohol dehydrogenase family)/acyl carrier protein
MFKVITYSPLHLANTALAIETVKADSIALFNLEYCEDSKIEKAIENLKYTLSVIPKNATIGVKSPFNKISSYKSLIDLLIGHKSILVVSDLSSTEKEGVDLPNWITNSDLEIWGEITSKSQESLLYNNSIQSIIIKGNESGGDIGSESSFVLSAHLINKSKKDVFVQGGIGFHTSAACFAAGAKGVVVDDHLLAMDHSPLPIHWKKTIKHLAIENTVITTQNNRIIRTVNHPLFKDSKEIGWGNPSLTKWPVGQTIGFAEQLANEYKTVGRLIKAIVENALLNVKEAKVYQPLAPNSKLAESHGTRFPIVQGPMTRVSDVPSFINAVAKSGGLPFLALSMISGNAVAELLEETQSRLGEKPWGVGILGFVPEKLRVHQFNEIKKIKPPFALLAGGTVAQVKEFEEEGIPAYIHSPVPSLLKIFLEKGCKRFVFEGRECGGHVGPIGSFTLWESAIKILLELPKVEAEQIHVLFAGGIHNDISASMLAAMSGQLAAKGIKVGVLMGTAYLFTSEVCESGAILPRFQQTAIDCKRTAVIETSPGHAIRCADTPFIQEFESEKEKGNKDLEKLTLGRLRIASKGLKRNNIGELAKISEKDQYDNGLFMLGEVAGMMTSLTSMEELHVEVSKKGNELLRKVELLKESTEEMTPSNIAVVGISTILPKADSPNNFWTNIINKVDAITEVPLSRWDWKLYYDEDKKKRDKINSKWGGFIDDVIFDPLKFGIPPHSLKSISPAQLLLLEAVDRALKDAGYGEGGFDNEHTSVIVGSDGTSTLKTQYATRSLSPLTMDLLTKEDLDRLPEWNEESFPGILTNVLAGRIANRFNLGGANFTVDSACASSLTAIDLAIKELEHGNSNMVIAAGADIAQSPFSYTAFSKTQALSPTGKSQPFNKDADGIVISEGIAVVLLKRLEDAERDGDKIYCVIKGAASSSDGKGLGLTAPRSRGQERALNRAYRKAGYSPSTLGSYEAHGTGTSVGDKVELTSINNVLENAGANEDSCVVGSVKSLIGHTKTTAGIVGLIKSALSLHYQTLAPHPMNGDPIDLLNQNATPVYLLENARPWFKDAIHPRRTGISAFGFGGTNTHVTIEEYRKNTKKDLVGHEKWPAELFIFEGLTSDEMLKTVNNWAAVLKDGLMTSLKDLSFISFNESQAKKNSKVKLSIVAENKESLINLLERVALKLSEDPDLLLPPQIALNLNSEQTEGKLGFVFPGQGSQYSNMARENTLYFKELREVIDLANDKLSGDIKMDKLLFPKASFSQETTDYWQDKLRATENAQPAIGTISMGYLNFLKSLEIKPEVVAGHSYGEFTALHAAGVLSSNDLFTISQKRGLIMAGGCEVDGTMAVVGGTPEQVSSYLNADVNIANLNAPKQTVISGERNAVYQVMAKIKKDGLKVKEIAVAGPFHTPFFKTAQQPLMEAINSLSFNSPEIPVYSNTTGKVYPQNLEKIIDLLNQHLLSPVRFSDEIEQMYEDGVRLFLEVGPNKVLTGLIDQILEGKSYKAIAVEGQGGGVKGTLSAVGAIYTAGYELNIENLYEGRNCKFLSLSDAINKAKEETFSSASVLLHGGGVRKIDEAVAISGVSQLIDSSNRKEIESVEVLKLSHSSCKLNDSDQLLEGYQSYQQTMQQFLASQETMMGHFLRGESIPNQQINATPIPLTSPKKDQSPLVNEEIESVEIEEIKPELTETKKSINKGDLAVKMIAIISERTGYPSDMLNEDIDLEAELGIDSIKRMEILDKVLKELSADHETKLQGFMPQLMRAKSINEFINIAFDKEIIQTLEEVSETSITNEIPVGAIKEDTNTETCARFVMESVIQELPFKGDPVLTGVHLITADSGNIADLLAKKIESFGGTPILLGEDVLASFDFLEAKLLLIFEKYPEISSVIHCAPLSKISMPEELKEWKNLTQTQSKSLFQILRFASLKDEKSIHYPIKKVITTSSFGGYFGRKAKTSNGLPSAGGNAGMLKALGKERTDIDIKVLDFDSLLLESEVAYRIVRELANTGGKIEIGYPNGERVIFQPIAAELEDQDSSEDQRLDEGSVVLATGGAKGITAEITKSMVVPGMKLIVIGRSKEIDLETTPKGGANTSFHKLIEQGVDVEYFSVDVKDDQAFKELIEYIYSTYGRLDAVIHGAGIIEDDHIEQKGMDSFNKVFDTKVDTAFLLFKYLRPESLKLLVFFGSVSGRFGNQGQTDYAAANEVLNRFAWYLHQKWPNTRTLTINWGPWSMIGMASPMVIRLLKSQGMEPIHPNEGCNFFLREIRQGNNETSEVIAGDGPWGNLDEMIFPELELEQIFNQTAIHNLS